MWEKVSIDIDQDKSIMIDILDKRYKGGGDVYLILHTSKNCPRRNDQVEGQIMFV